MAAGNNASANSSGNKSTFKNILVSVITTVLGSAAVYFIGFHDNDSFKERQDANIRAWNSLTGYETFYANSIDKISCMGETPEAYKEFAREMDQTATNMLNIKSEALADNKLKSLIDRRVQTIKDTKETMQAYIDKTAALLQQKDTATLLNEQAKFATDMEAIAKRDNDFINEVTPQLEKEYDTKLERPKRQESDISTITGNWKMDGEIELTIAADKTFTWKKIDGNFNGTWQLTDRNITFTFSDGETITYTVKKIKDKTALFQNTANNIHSTLCRL
jgi:hypothetical protein